jgi:hypothetical protein
MGFDFNIAEEREEYAERRAYSRCVIEIEYADNPQRYVRKPCVAGHVRR